MFSIQMGMLALDNLLSRCGLTLLYILHRELSAVLHSHQVENNWFLEVCTEDTYCVPLPVCHFLNFPPPSSPPLPAQAVMGLYNYGILALVTL